MGERPPRGPATFRQRDVEAFIRAARKAGETGPVRAEIAGGKIVVIISRENASETTEADEWEGAKCR